MRRGSKKESDKIKVKRKEIKEHYIILILKLLVLINIKLVHEYTIMTRIQKIQYIIY